MKSKSKRFLSTLPVVMTAPALMFHTDSTASYEISVLTALKINAATLTVSK